MTTCDPAVAVSENAVEARLWSATVRVVTTSPAERAEAAAHLARELDSLQPLGRLDPPAGPLLAAWAADQLADHLARHLGSPVLVDVDGEIATAGPDGSAGYASWQVLVQDRPGAPAAVIAIPTGMAIASARVGEPASADVVRPPWRCASAVADSAVSARVWALQAIGSAAGRAPQQESAPPGVDPTCPIRCVGWDGSVVASGGWPLEAELLDPYPVPAA